MNPEFDPLINLRDVIPPADPSFWPPAVGWWILALFAVVFALILIYSVKKVYTRFNRISIAHRISEIQNLEPELAVAELSILLRRIAVTQYPRQEVAGLTGQMWLQFLDQSGETKEFTQGPGKLLATAPYKKEIKKEDLKPLFHLCQVWASKVMWESKSVQI